MKPKKDESQQRYKVGDIVVTERSVACYNSLGKKEGYAAPGWKWRIVRVSLDWIGIHSNSKAIFYDVVSDSEPRAYRQRLREHQIFQKVGRHEGKDLYERKAKVNTRSTEQAG